MLTPLILLVAQFSPQGMPMQGGPGQGGPMDPGGPNSGEIKLVKKFDKDGNGWLNRAERDEARKSIPQRRGPGMGGRGGMQGGPQGGMQGGPQGGMQGGPQGGMQGGPQGGMQGGPQGGFQGGPPGGGMRGPGGAMTAGTAGPKVSPSQVKAVAGTDLYTKDAVRTVFLEFEAGDWEEEMAAFYNTDVEIPATMTVDGKTYPQVGVHFRGASSFMMVPAGNKRSLNVTMDFIDAKQKLYGVKTLNLLNSNGDASFMSSVLYSSIANKYIPAPRANHLKVVINGESWGIYVNAEQFNTDFVDKNFAKSAEAGKTGARWKVSGSPQGDAGLNYLGEDLAPYKQRYDIKSKDNDKDWQALVKLTKTLSETPIEQLEEALKPMLDIEGALWFLALDVSLANSDGYWVRASDYSIYRDPKGIFHVIPHDMNEAFRNEGRMGGGGGRRGPGGQGGPGGPGGQQGGPGGPGGQQGGGFQGGPGGPGGQQGGGFQGGPGGPGGQQGGGFQGGPGGPSGQQGGGFQGGPGGPGGQQGGGQVSQLDPLTGMTDLRKPLRSRLLQVPSLRAKYLANVKKLAAESMNWNALSPLINKTRDMLLPEIQADTRKNSSTQAFIDMLSTAAATPNGPRNLRSWIDARSQYLISYKEQPKQ